MTISWHGNYTIKITTPATTLVLDPHAKTATHPPFRGKADIVALTNPDSEAMSYLGGIPGTPTVINTPGEYSLSGLNVSAIGWHDEAGAEHSFHRWLIDDIVILHLGALTRSLSDSELQALEQTDIDILLLPIHETQNVPLKDAIATLTAIEPRVVIPINYTRVKEFAEQMGVSSRQSQPKFTASRSKLPQEGMETVILTA